MEELSSPVDRHDLTTAQAEASEWGIAPTIIPTSAEPSHEIIVDQGATVHTAMKDEYIIKPTRKGRSAGIMFGQDLTTAC